MDNAVWSLADKYRGRLSEGDLLSEVIRARLTERLIKSRSQALESMAPAEIYSAMKEVSEGQLGFFPGDMDLFLDIFHDSQGVDLIDFAAAVYGMGKGTAELTAPQNLSSYLCDYITAADPGSVLITDAEKFLPFIRTIVKQHCQRRLAFATKHHSIRLVLFLSLNDQGVDVLPQTDLDTTDLPYDCIVVLPAFGLIEKTGDEGYLSRYSDGIAAQRWLSRLSGTGALAIVVTAGFVFSRHYRAIRQYIAECFSIERIVALPEGAFRPWTSIRSYLLFIANREPRDTVIQSVDTQSGQWIVAEERVKRQSELASQVEWNIDLLLRDDDEDIKRFRTSQTPKAKLGNLAEIFRGKAVNKTEEAPDGNIAVVNIRDMVDNQIEYQGLDLILGDKRKLRRYELEQGDILLSTRGTVQKAAIFIQQDKMVIASSNILVFRVKRNAPVSAGYILLFLSSPIGKKLVEAFQRGSNVINLNNTDIMGVEVSLPPLEIQEALIDKFTSEHKIYQDAVRQASDRWNEVLQEIYNSLY